METKLLLETGSTDLSASDFHHHLLERFKEDLLKTRLPRTAHHYVKVIVHYLRFLENHDIKISETHKLHLNRYLLRKVHNDHITINTYNNYVTVIKRFYSFYSDIHQCFNPALSLEYQKNTEKGYFKLPLPFEKAAELLTLPDTSIQKGRRDALILDLALNHGLRMIEISRIQIEDLYHYNGHVEVSIWGKGKRKEEKGRGKNFEVLNPELVDIIQLYLQERTDDNPYLIVSHGNRQTQSGQLTTKTIRQIIDHYLVKVGVKSKQITAHSLRHTLATKLRAMNESKETIANRLRHASLNSTERYIKAIEIEQKHATPIKRMEWLK